MRDRVLRKGLVFGIIVLFIGAVVTPNISGISNQLKNKNLSATTITFNPFAEGWKYRKEITIDHAQVTGNLVNFPVLVSTIDSDLRDKAQLDGDDILFMDGKGEANQLFHEIESFDSSNGELVAWVNIPALSSSIDIEFYMYYGNLDCSSQEFPEGVWDSSYCGVWHLDDFLDSTNNGNDGNNHGTDDCSGKIGSAKDFVRANQDYMSFGDMSEPADNSITRATFEMWINPDDVEISNYLLAKFNSGDYEPDRLSYKWNIDSKNKMNFDVNSGTWYPWGDSINFEADESFILAGSWQYISVVIDLSEKNADIYYNGEEKDNTITIMGTPPAYFYDIYLPEQLGRMAAESSVGRFGGAMDEVRISKVCRSVEWISTQFNNQNDVLNFLTIGPEETKQKAYNNVLFLWFLEQLPVLQKIFTFLTILN